MDPWGTSHLRSPAPENEFSTDIKNIVFFKYDRNHLVDVSEKLIKFIFCKRISWSIVAKRTWDLEPQLKVCYYFNHVSRKKVSYKSKSIFMS